jgi:hypothetical protein
MHTSPDLSSLASPPVGERVQRISIAILGMSLSIPILFQYQWGEGLRAYHLPLTTAVTLAASIWYLCKGRVIAPRPSGRLITIIRLFFFFSCISLAVGTIRFRSLTGLVSFAYQMLFFGYLFLGYILIRNADRLLLFFRYVVLTSAFFCLVLFGYLTVVLGAQRLRSYDDFWALHNNIDVIATWFGWPNAYGCFLAICIVLCLCLWSLAPPNRKFLYLLTLICLSIGMLLTFSRSAYLLGATSLLGFSLSRRGALKKVVALLLVLALAGILAAERPELSAYLEYTGSAETRFAIANVLLDVIDPLTAVLGSGYQSTYVAFANYGDKTIVGQIVLDELSTHDEYMTMFTKTGIIGLGLFLAILVLIVLMCLKLARRHPDSKIRVICSHFFYILLGLLPVLIAGEYLRYWPVAIVFWMTAGSLLRLSQDLPRVQGKMASGPQPNSSAV